MFTFWIPQNLLINELKINVFQEAWNTTVSDKTMKAAAANKSKLKWSFYQFHYKKSAEKQK